MKDYTCTVLCIDGKSPQLIPSDCVDSGAQKVATRKSWYWEIILFQYCTNETLACSPFTSFFEPLLT